MKYINYVNIKQGTDSTQRFSNGNTLPLTQLPFAMAGFAPQTSGDNGNWFYHPKSRSLEGIRLTHQPSPWLGDYGHFCFLPQEGQVYTQNSLRWSGFRPEETILRPDYMAINILRYNAFLELTPTKRGAAIKVEYKGELQPRFAILPVKDICGYKLDCSSRMLTGFTKAHSWKIADNFALYFAMQFDCDFDEKNCFLTKPQEAMENVISGQGELYGYNIALTSKKVNIKLGVSYISEQQAIENLKQDHEEDFDTLRINAEILWESYLSRIKIETKSQKIMKTFYSCLYRMFLYPHIFHEVDCNGKIVHYCPTNGKINPGVMYTDNGFWDTFRTVYPMFSIIAPEIYAEILEGYVNVYNDSGWLPRWLSPGEIGAMPGTLIDAVIAHAAVTGCYKQEVLENAFEGMLKHSTQIPPEKRYGRDGIQEYLKLGYVPNDIYSESVNQTLDNAYGDFCISQTANVLGYDDCIEVYNQRSKNYANIFDSSTGFMRGKNIEGKMNPNFNPFDWGGEYCEGSAWQNSFGVYHDIEGLALLHGGNDALIEKLDELFKAPPLYNVGSYGCEIHEMTEMASADFGQCAISNQPSFHLPYLYAALGAQEKCKYWVEKLINEAFSNEDDGFPGDEDNGTMAGWYIFSCMGFYPICPGKAEYIKGIKLVDKVTINDKNIDINQIKGNTIKQSDLI